MQWKESSQFENPPSGTHVARCIKLIDMGTQPVTFQGETKYQRKVLISWELPTTLMEGIYKPECKGLPFGVSRRYTQSLSPASNLRKHLEGWRGKKFTKEELAGFDAKSILGKPCLLTLIENGEYINVESVSPLPKQMKCPKQVNPSVFFSLVPEECNQDDLRKLPEKLVQKIMESPEYRALVGEQPDPHSAEEPEAGSSAESDDNMPF